MFHRPTSFDDALAIKARLRSAVTPLAGGTDLIVGLNRGEPLPGEVLDLSAVGDNAGIESDNGALLLGAGVTWTQLGRLEIDCLARAALSVGGPQIRNLGTIGGNLATASPAGDGSVALLALNAEIELSHARRGSRWLRLADFFVSYRKTALADDELISRIRLPAPAALQGTAWNKIGKRGAVNISLVCAAAARWPDGRIALAFGSVAPVPLRAVQTENIVSGQRLTGESIERAAVRAEAEVQPIDDWRASADYRRAMCRVLTRRLLRQLQTPQERES
ncbi:MAG: xanthine dehydrogenase family protein subunit M [Planctomycetes bacterium]|nr:xanthine dehydrogenase family protein subunit M [Planctomycetota bacterium]